MTAFADDSYEARAARLRREFDGAFAAALPPAAGLTEDLLAIRLGGAPHAIRLRELTGLVVAHNIVQIPSRAPDLLGVASVRGGVVTVFSLERLLGFPASQVASPWLALVGTREPVGLAFPLLLQFVRVSREEILREDETLGKDHPAREYVSAGSQFGRIVDVQAIRKSLDTRASNADAEKGR